MAQVVNLRPPLPITVPIQRRRLDSPRPESAAASNSACSWTSLLHSLDCNGKFSCLFSDYSKQERARKALEKALGEKKMEFDKWDKEIKRREEAGGGGNSGRGSWFGWFGGGDHFWQEAQQASLAILGILVVYLIVAKGDVMLAAVFNPLLFALRGTRTGLTFLTSKITNRMHPARGFDASHEDMTTQVSAKDLVAGKWGNN